MSSVVRTSQIPYFSFHRSSTPTPYSLGNPALNCCGGSLSTLGNMNRPVAASAAADAAENAPHARPIQARRVSSGDVSSGSRVAAFATAGAAVRAAAPPGEATLVVLPARSGIGAAGGRGAGAGFAACAPAAAGAGATGAAPVAAAAAAVAGASPPGTGRCCGVAAGFAPVAGALGTTGLFSSAIYKLPHHLECFHRRLPHLHAPIVLAQAVDRRFQGIVFQRRRGAQAADHHVRYGILVGVLTNAPLDGLLDVLPIEHLAQHRHAFPVAVARQRDCRVPAHVRHFVL